MQLETIELVSNCIWLSSDPDDRVVTMFVNPLNIYINCYHETPCKEGNLYKEIVILCKLLSSKLKIESFDKINFCNFEDFSSIN